MVYAVMYVHVLAKLHPEIEKTCGAPQKEGSFMFVCVFSELIYLNL